MAMKQKVLEFANKVSGKKVGAKGSITVEDARYRILEPVVTDEMAEVALVMEFRKPQNAEELAAKCGKSLERTKELCWDLAMAGEIGRASCRERGLRLV